MKTHDFPQGGAEWNAHRAWPTKNASDAPAMMGCSPHESRSALIRRLATGIAPEIDAATQRRFDDGHRFEAQARPLAEAIVGDDLYPVTGSEGMYSASFDGLTMDSATAFEHKTINNELRGVLPKTVEGGTFEVPATLPLMYRVQMEQQLLVSGAERVLFMASKWAGETLVEERHCWYRPDEELRAAILNGWAQLQKDVTAYEPAPVVEPMPIWKSREALPALRVEVTGSVVASNLDAYKATALEVIRSINRELNTDSDFANAKADVKWLAEVEVRVAAAKEAILAQTAGIDAALKVLDFIDAESSRTRIDLDKLVKSREAAIKAEIIMTAQDAYRHHLVVLQAETEGCWVVLPAPDFAGAAKNKRSLDSLRDAVDTTLANAKIAADASARLVRERLAIIKTDGAGFEFLFPDRPTLIHKAADDLRLLIGARIGAHKAAEAEKERVLIEAEAAEAARATAAAEAATAAALEAALAKAEAERRASEAAARVVVQAAAPEAPAPAPAPAAQSVMAFARPAPAAKATEPATLTLGVICERVGPGFTMTAAFLSDVLGIQHSATDKAAKLYRESDWPRICAALASHLVAKQAASA